MNGSIAAGVQSNVGSANGTATTGNKKNDNGLHGQSADKVRNIVGPYNEKAQQLAENDPIGRVFTDHKEAHVEMVREKSLEAGDGIKQAIENGNMGGKAGEGRVSFSSEIDSKTIEGAALSHDTGMSGDGYALCPIKNEVGETVGYEKNEDGSYRVKNEDNGNFNEVRGNHSLNSAINVLENREKYIGAGYSNEQVDKMAVECMAHSKSSSGVSDLNSKENWSDCFDRIDATVDAYNKDHPDSPISFDRSVFENSDEKLGSLASETLAIRIGDVSRDSCAGAEAQSGEAVNVDRSTLSDRAGTVRGELEKANITIGDSGDQITSNKSRQVHTGEQNIVNNHTFLGENGNLTHEITVNDGNSGPRCTQDAIEDHLGELATAKDMEFDVNIKFNRECDEYAKAAYELFQDIVYGAYDNVYIHYSWD